MGILATPGSGLFARVRLTIIPHTDKGSHQGTGIPKAAQLFAPKASAFPHITSRPTLYILIIQASENPVGTCGFPRGEFTHFPQREIILVPPGVFSATFCLTALAPGKAPGRIAIAFSFASTFWQCFLALCSLGQLSTSIILCCTGFGIDNFPRLDGFWQFA